MTLFAVACAGLFPLLHMGRPWLAYWLFPYPNSMGVWPQFRSPLVWDVFAVSTYATISLLFWFVGLIPDLATLRDRADNKLVQIDLTACWPWAGGVRRGIGQRYETAYLLLAGLATPLVLSVHTVVSFDFAVGIVPGWHTTIFPPYFVAGAIYSGFAMVLMLAIPIRKFYSVEDFITERHLREFRQGHARHRPDRRPTAMRWKPSWAGTAAIRYEGFWWNRLHGPYAWYYLALLFLQYCHPAGAVDSQVPHQSGLAVPGFVRVLVGMWLERFIIVVVSLHRDFLTSSWGMYYPTRWDWADVHRNDRDVPARPCSCLFACCP